MDVLLFKESVDVYTEREINEIQLEGYNSWRICKESSQSDEIFMLKSNVLSIIRRLKYTLRYSLRRL